MRAVFSAATLFFPIGLFPAGLFRAGCVQKIAVLMLLLTAVAPAHAEDTTGRVVFIQERAVKRPLIVLDPGHGGEDIGAVGSGGIKEKEIVLEIALALRELLEERLRARVLLTRDTDVSLALQERIAVANRERADLFLSIHANASEHKTASGVETYYLDNTDDRSSMKLAERENSTMHVAALGGDLGFMVSDLIQGGKLEDSISLSHHIQEELHLTLSQYFKGVNNLGVKKAPFYVLVGAHMPCVLAEVSFIDHPIEGKRLAEPRYRTLTALGLYQGIRRYFAKEAPSAPEEELRRVALPSGQKPVM